jgi:hypothetical protein
VEFFLNETPRTSFSTRPSTRWVETDLGFVEYIVLLQHRERWQSIGTILSSKAVVQQFCLELQHKMRVSYTSPPALPVNLRVVQDSSTSVPQ